MNKKFLSSAILALAVSTGCSASAAETRNSGGLSGSQGVCLDLHSLVVPGPDITFEITEATYREQGHVLDLRFGQTSPPLPAHCEVYGQYGKRKGLDGQAYAVKFHMRLPVVWNERFFFQGGGGLNGSVGNAVGPTGSGGQLALVQGYAVVSHDSGHDAQLNKDPSRGGEAAFGFDFEARRNYAHASIKNTHEVAQSVINAFFNAKPRHSYFFGCSKGGQEGMISAQRYPELFDGIVATAPGMSLPKAAIAQAWDTQVFATLMEPGSDVADLAATFSESDLQLASTAVAETCDGLDGLEDGIIGNYPACTAERVSTSLTARQCGGDPESDCLTKAQIEALKRVFGGARNSEGEALYANFPFDTGIADPGWRRWKLGSAQMPALNVMLGASSLPTVFSTPPYAASADANTLLAHQLSYDFDQDAAKIHATSAQFPESAWQLMQATSPDLDAFKGRGGKLIVPHGLSDPVFSVNDTLAWWRQVNERYEGEAGDFARVFPVPGMGHCGGGPSTDRFDAFGALVEWVENGKAPDRIMAEAGPDTPWPGIRRPLCPYPATMTYVGDDEFECRVADK